MGLYASMIEVNAYHQPGVEAGKKAAGRVLAIQAGVLAVLKAENAGASAGTAGLSAETVAAKLDEDTEFTAAIGGEADVETVFHILEHLAANDRVSVVRSGPVWESVYSLR